MTRHTVTGTAPDFVLAGSDGEPVGLVRIMSIYERYKQCLDGTTRNSVEERYLERVNNEWKLVSVTVLVAK